MKKGLALLCVFLLQVCVAKDQVVVPDSAFLIDGIQAVVFGQGGTQVITKSDVLRPNLSGAQQTLDDIIFERLVYLDAQKYKIMQDDAAIDKYLAMVQKENNLTLDQLKEVFASAGYTYQEGRKQFGILQTVQSMLDFKIRSQVIVPRKQVEAYYREHPEVREEEVSVRYGFMPYMNEKRHEQEKAFHYMARTGKMMKGVDWGEPFWLKRSEVSDDKAFIFSLGPDQISKPLKTDRGFEVYHLLERRDEYVASLEERYHEIADTLRRPIFEDLLDRYKKQLFESVAIVMFA